MNAASRRTDKKTTHTKKTVFAAGGVVWRHDGARDSVEVALVHRPRYNDWTLPKGKTRGDETFLHTAIREIKEETGYDVRIGRHLRLVHYRTDRSTEKLVHYWSAQALDGEFVANREVDELRWLDTNSAAAALSYPLDKSVLAEFVRIPADLKTLLLVRHGRAGQKARYHGDDTLRPLDKLGLRQAEALVPQCLVFRPDHVHAADRTRCEQTVTPLADALDTAIISEPALSEDAYAASPRDAQARLLEIAASNGVHTVCSQGKVIPPLVSWVASRNQLRVPQRMTRKGSMWVLSFDSDLTLVDLDYIDSAIPPKH